MSTTSSSQHRGRSDAEFRRVGSYATEYAAQLAVEHLAAQGLPRETLWIVAADIHAPDGWRERTRRQPKTARALVVGTAVAVVLFAVTGVSSRVSLIDVLAGLAAGALAALAAGEIERWHARRVRHRARTSRTVEADRFDVLCSDTSDRVAHLLARWWDPQAVPVAPRRRAAADRHEALTGQRLS